MTIQIKLLAGRAREEVADVWRELEERCDCGLSVSWEWTETWLRHYGDAVPHRFAIGFEDGAACAAALLTFEVRRKARMLPIRVVHLGTAGEPTGGVYVEWNGLLSLPEAREAAATGLLAALRHERGWDQLSLDGFDPGHASAFLGDHGAWEVRHEPSAVVDLAAVRADGREVLEVFGGGARRRLRQSLKRFGDLEGEWAAGPQQAAEILGELMELHELGWRRRGQPGVFADARFAAFHRELVARLVPQERAILFRVRAGSETVGCLYCLVDRGRVLFYQSGLRGYEDSRLRPGLVTHLMCIQACLERGFDEYDFLAGEARYKRELSTTAREQIWATLRRRRLRFALVDAARPLWRLARAVPLEPQ